MARKRVTVMVSDLSGKEIPDDKYAKVVITQDGRRYTLDASIDELGKFVAAGRESKRPGRPKAAA